MRRSPRHVFLFVLLRLWCLIAAGILIAVIYAVAVIITGVALYCCFLFIVICRFILLLFVCFVISTNINHVIYSYSYYYVWYLYGSITAIIIIFIIRSSSSSTVLSLLFFPSSLLSLFLKYYLYFYRHIFFMDMNCIIIIVGLKLLNFHI